MTTYDIQFPQEESPWLKSMIAAEGAPSSARRSPPYPRADKVRQFCRPDPTRSITLPGPQLALAEARRPTRDRDRFSTANSVGHPSRSA